MIRQRYRCADHQRVRYTKLVRFAGLCGVLGAVLPQIMIFAATILSPWFRWDTNALSELGVGEESTLFNSAVLLGGILSSLFALGLWQYLKDARLVRIGVAIIVLSNVFLALVGVFTINYHVMHAIVSFGFFVLAPLGFLLIGFETKENAIKRVSIVCGISALLAILVLPLIVFVLQFKVGFAVPEMIEALIISFWILFMAAKLVKQ